MKKWRSSRGLFLSAVGTGAMLNPLNSSMIALAIPNIQRDFDLSYVTVSWLISSFYLASAVTQPIAGRLGDLIGRRKMFLGGSYISSGICPRCSFSLCICDFTAHAIVSSSW